MSRTDFDRLRRAIPVHPLTSVRLFALCAAAAACGSCTDDAVQPLADGSVSVDMAEMSDASVDGGLDAARLDAGALPDLSFDMPPEPPRTLPCEPRRTPILCNARRIVDACAAFGEECTRAPSACLSRKPLGELCRGRGECDDGLVCTATISYGVCAPTPGEGEACTDTCLDPAELFCDRDASPPVCTRKRTAGGSCATGAESCRDGLFCSVAFLCTARGADGAECASTSECADSLDCAIGVCASAPVLGGECTGVCAPGLFCSAATFPGVCESRIPDGGACNGFVMGVTPDCEDGLRCFFDARFVGQCAAPVAMGGDCTTDLDTCDVGTSCEAGVCSAIVDPPAAPVGAPCDPRACVRGAYCGTLPAEAGICWSSSCEG